MQHTRMTVTPHWPDMCRKLPDTVTLLAVLSPAEPTHNQMLSIHVVHVFCMEGGCKLSQSVKLSGLSRGKSCAQHDDATDSRCAQACKPGGLSDLNSNLIWSCCIAGRSTKCASPIMCTTLGKITTLGKMHNLLMHNLLKGVQRF